MSRFVPFAWEVLNTHHARFLMLLSVIGKSAWKGQSPLTTSAGSNMLFGSRGSNHWVRHTRELLSDWGSQLEQSILRTKGMSTRKCMQDQPHSLLADCSVGRKRTMPRWTLPAIRGQRQLTQGSYKRLIIRAQRYIGVESFERCVTENAFEVLCCRLK